MRLGRHAYLVNTSHQMMIWYIRDDCKCYGMVRVWLSMILWVIIIIIIIIIHNGGRDEGEKKKTAFMYTSIYFLSFYGI